MTLATEDELVCDRCGRAPGTIGEDQTPYCWACSHECTFTRAELDADQKLACSRCGAEVSASYEPGRCYSDDGLAGRPLHVDIVPDGITSLVKVTCGGRVLYNDAADPAEIRSNLYVFLRACIRVLTRPVPPELKPS